MHKNYPRNEMKMTICSLTPSKVLTAKKRKKPYIIRDQKLKGFHLKIYPSGRKTFTITCLRGGKQYNERIGDAGQDCGRVVAERRHHHRGTRFPLHSLGGGIPGADCQQLFLNKP